MIRSERDAARLPVQPSARTLSLSVALGLWLAASAVGAQPRAPTPDVGHPASEQRAPARPTEGSAPQIDAAEVEEIELGKTRDRRRAARREKLEAVWGDLIRTAPALVEFQLHGWRMARLRRLGRLAAHSNEPALAERIARLETKEAARHEKQLSRLKHQAPTPSAAPRPRRVPPVPTRAATTAAPASSE